MGFKDIIIICGVFCGIVALLARLGPLSKSYISLFSIMLILLAFFPFHDRNYLELGLYVISFIVCLSVAVDLAIRKSR